MSDAGLRKKRATSFEQKVVNFLKEMEFDHVDGARDDFRIGGHQIDAIGGKEHALFIIECTMAERHGPKCLRSKITNLRGKAHEIEVNVLKDPKYKDHYDAVFFVLATKDIEMLKVDVKYAKHDDDLERVEVGLWDENHMDYYIDLKKKIQEWALYDFYGDLGLIGSEEDPIRVPAMRTKLGDEIIMYQFTINPQKLKKVAYVARRGISNKSYYQREIKKDKISKITKYIDKKGNLLPNNIILGFDDWATKHVKFDKPYSVEGFTDWYNDRKPNTGGNTEFGILQFPAAYKSCWIIDGQHRFYGFKDADRNLSVPVCVISGLDVGTQSNIFLDINKFQTAIPPSLQLDLNGLLFPSTEDGRISNTAKKLNAEGACKEIINIPSMIPVGKGAGLKKLPALCTAIKDLKLVTPELRTNKSANPFYDRENPDNTPTLLAKALNEFFNVMEDVFPEDFSRLQKGFVLGDGSGIVMLRIFENIVAYSISQHRKASIEMMKSCLTPIKSDIEQITISDKLLSDAKGACGNKTGQTKYYENFVRTIRKGIGDDTFGGKLEIATERDYLEAETNAKALLQAVFEPKYDKMWFQEIATKNERGYANANRRQDRDDSKLYLHIGLGHCTQIIERRIDDFKEVFMSGPEPFESVDMIRIGLKKIRQYKNIASHRTESYSSIDAQHTELYLRQFNACINSFTQKIARAAAEKTKDDLKNKLNEFRESAESSEGFVTKN